MNVRLYGLVNGSFIGTISADMCCPRTMRSYLANEKGIHQERITLYDAKNISEELCRIQEIEDMDVLIYLRTPANGGKTCPSTSFWWDYIGNPIIGLWESERGAFQIGNDPFTGRIFFKEFIDSPGPKSAFFHGWLTGKGLEDGKFVWSVNIARVEANKNPWYGTSFGMVPIIIGCIEIIYNAPNLMVKVDDEDGAPALHTVCTRISD